MGAMEFKKKYARGMGRRPGRNSEALTKTGGSRSYLETLRYANLAIPLRLVPLRVPAGYAEDILLRQLAEQEK